MAAEIHRVLRPGGIVYADTPFLQQVHEGAYDFTRFTDSGHRFLFRRFERIDSGSVAGCGHGAALVGRLLRPRADPVGPAGPDRLPVLLLAELARPVPRPEALRRRAPAASSSSAARPSSRSRAPTSSTTTRAACRARGSSCSPVPASPPRAACRRSATPTGSGRATGSRTSPPPRPTSTSPRSCTSSTTHAGRRSPASSPTPPTSRWPGWKPRSATTCSSSPRTSTTCTSAPAPRGCCTCTAPCGRRCAGPARTRVEWEGDLGDFPPCPTCHEMELRPDVVWFGEVPYEMDRIFTALESADLFVSIGTSGAVYPAAGFVQAAAGVRRPHARAQPGPQRGHALLPRGPARPRPASWCRRGWTSVLGGYGDGMTRLLGLLLALVVALGPASAAVGRAPPRPPAHTSSTWRRRRRRPRGPSGWPT